MMNPKTESRTPTLDQCIEQFYAGAQVFMNLGFNSDAIRVTKNIVGPGKILYWGMHLEWRGRESNVFVLPDAWMAGVSDEEFNTKWNAFVRRMSAKPRDEELHAHMKTVIEHSFL